MQVIPGNAIHIGQRKQQQDAFGLSDFDDAEFVAHGGYLAVVADGIGGLQYGARAAMVAISEFVGNYMGKLCEQSVEEALDQALEAANQAVLNEAYWRNCSDQMGSTLVAALIYQGHLYWRAVGDSHVYLYREGRLSQLNADHNFARELQRQVNEGLLCQAQADYHPDRDALECYLGLHPLHEVERNANPLPLQAQDKVLLCSDGIDGVLSAEEIMACLANAPMLAAQLLCDSTLQKQHANQDNLTAVVLGYQAEVTDTIQTKPRNRWWLFGLT
jgi:PPM family protein phosphatase